MKQSFKDELLLRLKDINKERSHIMSILSINDSDFEETSLSDGNVNNVAKQDNKAITPKGTPRDITPWEDYTFLMLEEIGGEGSSKDVINAVKRANPKIPDKTIKNAVRSKLAKLATDGRIKSTPISKSRKDGNRYSVIEQKKV